LVLDNSADGTDRNVSIGGGAVSGLTGNAVSVIEAEVSSTTILSGSGSDTFAVTPQPNMAVDIVGGDPAPPTSPGDQLNLTFNGAADPALSGSLEVDGLQGTWNFSNRAAVSFSEIETMTPQVAASVVVVSGTPKSTNINTPFTDPLVVEVRDIAGNPLAGYDVTFTAPGAGASAQLTLPAQTDGAGRTQVSAQANAVAGTYAVVATAFGASTNAVFMLTNLGVRQASTAGNFGLALLVVLLLGAGMITMRTLRPHE